MWKKELCKKDIQKSYQEIVWHIRPHKPQIVVFSRAKGKALASNLP